MMLSRTYPPHDDLLPYIRRHYVFEADLPQDATIEDGLLSETAFVRILLKGDWSARNEAGEWGGAGQALLFGANAKPFPARVRGSFCVAGFAIRPSAWSALFDRPACHFVDRMLPLAEAWGQEADDMLAALEAATDDVDRIAAMELAIRAQLAKIGKPDVDAHMAEFEQIARADSTTRVESLGKRFGMSVRQIERRCLATFGLSPKGVLRRSRFLDMATALRGFSTPSEEQLAALRYFDQSHLNREFRHYVGMPPGAFSRSVTPLLTAGLKLRDEGKRLIPPV